MLLKTSDLKDIDNKISRLERTYMSISSTDPETLSEKIVDLSGNVEFQFETARSVDPSTQLEYFVDCNGIVIRFHLK